MELRQCMPATKSSEPRLQSDPNAEFDFLRRAQGFDPYSTYATKTYQSNWEHAISCYEALVPTCSNLWLACCDLVQGLTPYKSQKIHPQTTFPAYRSEVVKWLSEDFRRTADYCRIIALSNLACAARRVKFFQKAIDALAEAREIPIQTYSDMFDLVTSHFILLREFDKDLESTVSCA